MLPLARAPPSSYVEALAIEDTWLNQATGCAPDLLANWTCGLPCAKAGVLAPLLASNRSDETLALTARKSATECVVVFRGSKNVYNVLKDLDFFPRALKGCKGCKVHSGFQDSWRSLQPQVLGHLSKLSCENSTVSIVGHSLGAAMAALAAYDLAEPVYASLPPSLPLGSVSSLAPRARWAVRRVYTYGQPRVGNDHFAAAFDARLGRLGVTHYRVVDYRDAVPHLPLADMFWEGWTHTGEEVYYHATKLGAYTACRAANDTRCSAQWSLIDCLTHTCDHCSYLGMNPCDCGKTAPHCHEPKDEPKDEPKEWRR